MSTATDESRIDDTESEKNRFAKSDAARTKRTEIITSNGQEPIVFSVTEQTIKPMADKYLKLRVSGIHDKAGLEVCHRARMDCVKARTTCEREHKAVKEDALRECQRIDKSKRDILALIAPIERHLEGQEDAVAKELARIAQEKLDAMINSRLEILSDAGESSLTREQLGTISDDAFALEVIRVAEATRLRQQAEEAARIERERMAAENHRLATEREALEIAKRDHDREVARLKKIEDDRIAEAQADLDRQREAIAAENKRLAVEAERKRQDEDRERIRQQVAEQTRIETWRDPQHAGVGTMRLFEIHEGQRVVYVPMHAAGDVTHPDVERGAVSSVGTTVAFVRFDEHVKKFGWLGATSQACYPADLVEEPKT